MIDVNVAFGPYPFRDLPDGEPHTLVQTLRQAGITQVVLGLEDVSTYPDLIAELLRREYSDEDVRKIAGKNILRVLKRAEEVARAGR